MIRHFSARVLGAALFCLSLTAPALAQNAPTPAPSSSPLTTIVHVTTADRSDHTLKNTARTTYVVTADQIKAEGLRTVGEALTTVPGVEVATYGAIGAGTSYGIRGSSSAQVLVLVNGLPAPGTFSNSVELSQLSTLGVKQIEIVEGGGSTLYGAGSLGGIINVITNDQHAPPSASARYGSYGDREISATADGFTAQRINADNIFPITGTADARFNADYEYSNLGYTYKAKLGNIDASFNGGISSDNVGIPGSYEFPSPTSREHDVNAIGQLSFSLHRAQSLSTLDLGGTRQQTTDTCIYTPYGATPVIDPNCYDPLPSLDLDSRVNVALRNAVTGNNEQLLYGIDLARGVARGDNGNYPQPATTAGPGVPASPAIPEIASGAIAQTAIYAQESFSLQNGGHVYAGVRGERDGGFGGAVSPSVGFIDPLSKNMSLKANYATAFRAPDATSLYFPGYGNPNLQPERGQVGDITLQDNALAGGTELTWFTARTNDLIEAYQDPSTLAYYAKNVDHALTNGAVFSVKTLPYNGVYAKVDITDLYQAQDLVAESRLPNDAVITANATLGILPATTGSFDGAGVTARIVGNRSAVDYYQPTFDQAVTYTNLSAHIRFRASQHLAITFIGNNLDDQRYAEINGYPSPGRAFAVELGTR